MRTFDNEKNRSAAEKSLITILKAGFWVSALTTTFCVANWLYELSFPYVGGVLTYVGISASVATTGYWLAIFLAIVRPLHTVEITIGLSAKMVFTEFAGFMATRGTGTYTAMRNIAFVGWLFIFVTLTAFSGLTSYYGAKMAAANANISVNTDKVQNLPRERQNAVSAATKIQQDKLAVLQEEKEKAIAKAENGIAGETKRLAKRGNEWAKNEISSAINSAARPYATKIAKAEADLIAAQKEADKRYDKIETAMLSANQIEIGGAQEKSKSNSVFTTLFGIAPLILSIGGIAIISMSEVAAKLPARASNNSSTNTAQGFGSVSSAKNQTNGDPF